MSSSINRHFTLSYRQPDEYRFSHDSVFLARRVFEMTQTLSHRPQRILDLCAGCGVIGIDFLVHLQNAGLPLPSKIDFLEVQNVYHPYFASNMAQMPNIEKFEFITLNYGEVFSRPDLRAQYDLILCNPPYFKKEMGVLSDSDFKNRCRFFMDADLQNLFEAVAYLLKPAGTAYVLLKDLSENGHSLQDDMAVFSDRLRFTWLEKIRTTDLYQIQLL